MTYHLTAYSPWEGYRVMFNGSKGRLELEMVETDHVAPGATGLIKGDAGTKPRRATPCASIHFGASRARSPVPYEREGHGGGDARMLATCRCGPAERRRRRGGRGRRPSLRIGLAANESIALGLPVRIPPMVQS